MLKLYASSSNASSRKAARWLNEHHIPFITQNLTKQPITADEVKQILCLTDNGCSDILASRSHTYHRLVYRQHLDFGSLSMMSFVNLVVKHPDLVHWPILIDADRGQLLIGYNQNQIRCFLPHKYRVFEMNRMVHQLDA